MATIVSIERYDQCDIYVMQNDVEWYGIAAETSFGEMVDKAQQNNCTVITKNGGGKWYLKAQGKPYTEAKSKAEEASGKTPRVKAWILRYDE